MSEGYRGLVGAFVYAFRKTDSWVFRVYAILSAVVGLYIALLIGLAIVAWAGTTMAFGDQAFLAVIGIVLLVPLFTPVLVTARRLRQGTSTEHAAVLVSLAGYGFIASIILALLITDPTRHSIPGRMGALILVIQDIPRPFGVVPPIIAAVIIAIAIRYTRP